MSLALSKCYDLRDLAEMQEEMGIVTEHFGSATEQAEMRVWEYCTAVHAINQWAVHTPRSTERLVDVGGAGSPFWRMVPPAFDTYTVDPAAPGNVTLATYLLEGSTPLADVVTCLSVIEHVPDLDQFLYHLSCLVAPGGLLVLTTDCTDQPSDPTTGFPKDDRHFHWDRQRIFNPQSLEGIQGMLEAHDLSVFGGVDWTYHGDYANWGYSCASLVMVKRP